MFDSIVENRVRDRDFLKIVYVTEILLHGTTKMRIIELFRRKKRSQIKRLTYKRFFKLTNKGNNL